MVPILNVFASVSIGGMNFFDIVPAVWRGQADLFTDLLRGNQSQPEVLGRLPILHPGLVFSIMLQTGIQF